jgi:thiol-disulfide isomerase/thioredoxin
MKITRATSNRRLWLAAMFAAPWSNAVLGADAQRQAWLRQPVKPELHLRQLDGTDWRLSEQRGQVMLLNFWASWCEPCRTEMPAFENLSKRYESQGLQVMAINYRETGAAVQRFIDSTNLHLPVLRDAGGAAAQSLGVHTFPTTIALDRQGRARFVVVGECDWSGATAAGWIAELLSIR